MVIMNNSFCRTKPSSITQASYYKAVNKGTCKTWELTKFEINEVMNIMPWLCLGNWGFTKLGVTV